MRLIYAFPEPLPLERARGLQAVHTVAALACAGVDVEFAFAPVAGPGGTVDPFEHYGLVRPRNVTLTTVARSLPWPLSGVHSNRLFFANLRRRFGDRLLSEPLLVRHLKLAAKLAQELPGACFAYEAHEVFGDTAAPGKREANRQLERIVMAPTGAVLANSAATAQRLKKLYGDPKILEVVPNGVVRPEWLPDKHWPKAGRHIVYAGSFFPWKGVSELVSAAGRLAGCRLLLMGGDERRIAELKSQCLPGGAEIEFSGRLPHAQVMVRLGESCIAILPNRDDTDSAFTSPIKLFEYMAAGCAIVASDLPALREILGEDDAVWVRPGDPVSLAVGIRRLADDTRHAQLLGERVRARSIEFTWEARGRRVKAILERMLASRRSA
ncbi:MAG: glycosyltransferase [Betaproteobacteria bacterium]|nr:glycosyltransferase [Betaproteobacteria bacterium]